MNDFGRKLLTHSGIYFTGNIMMRAVSFLMLPIYTRYLSPADYGIIELLAMTIDLVGILLGLRIGQAIFRFYHEYDSLRDRHAVISTALYLVGVLNICGVLLLLAFSQPLSNLLFNGEEGQHWLMIFSLTLFFHSYIEIPMIYLRILQRPWLYVSISCLKVLLQVSLNIWFIVILGMRVEGMIYSAVLSGGVMALLLLTFTLRQTGWRWSKEQAKQMTIFSLPMVLTSLISFYITFGDRYFLRAWAGLEEVGLYALGYKFGFLLAFIIAGPFSNIWDAEKYRVYDLPDARSIFQQTFLGFSAVLLVAVTAISLFIEDLLKIMSAPAFWSAYQVVPLVLIAYLFNAWYGFTNMGILVRKKTIEMTWGTLLASLVATIFYVLLIPRWGGVGAAVATVLALGSRCVWTTWRSTQLYDMGLQWGKVFLLALPALALYALSRFTPEAMVWSLTCNLLLFLCYLFCLMAMPVLPPAWRQLLRTAFFRPWRLFAAMRPAQVREGVSEGSP
jgi:O-antigen/teichoic acid export membrane protein